MTIAGDGYPGSSGDGSPATQARLNRPTGVAVGADGSVWIADQQNHRIRQLFATIPGFNAADLTIAAEDGRQLYRFNASGRHLSTVDTLTGTTLYAFIYDSAGRLTTVTDADSNVLTIERDSSGHLIAIMAPFGQRTALTVDSNGYLAHVTNPAGEAYAMHYTTDGLLTRFTNPRGNTSTFTYDALGRLQRDANAGGGRQDLARTELANGNGYAVSRTTALNRTTTYTVEDRSTGDRQRTVTTPDGLTTTTLERTNGGKTVTTPDGTVIDTLEGPDPRFGMQAPITTAQTVTTGGLTATVNRTATVSPANPTDPLAFDTLTRTTTVNGHTATRVYTAATRRTAITSPVGRQRYTVADGQGRVIESGVAGIEPIRLSYDARGQLTHIAQGSGDERQITLDYNPQGYLTRLTDALNQSQTFNHDPVGRVVGQTLANGQILGYAYDANGNPTQLIPPGQPAHGMDYGPMDLMTGYLPPTVINGGDTGYQYNADQQLTWINRPDGGVLTFDYDPAGRLQTLNAPIGPYDYRYNAVGQLDGITAPGGVTLDYGYQGALLTDITWSGPIAGRVGYGYNNDFRLAQLTLNDADPMVYQYDADGLLTQVGDLILTRSLINGLLTDTTLDRVTTHYAHDRFGDVSTFTAQLNEIIDAGSAIVAGIPRHQDALHATFPKTPNPIAEKTTAGTVVWLHITTARDALGRITQKTETVDGVTTLYEYAYDAIGQLIEVKQNGGVTATYAYDGNGNRLSKTGPGINETGTYDAQDRLLDYAGATYTHGPNGERQRKVQESQTTTYAYDALGNLRQVHLPDGRTMDYLIDGQNRRIGKRINGVLVQSLLYQDQLRPAAELDGAGHIVSRFVYGTHINVPDYLIQNGQTYRILTDYRGSPRLVVHTATGVVEQRLDYDEYGKVLLDTNPGFQPFGFAGGLYDRDTGLVRFGARDYDPQTGRWTAKDPIRFAGGDANLYRYVGNDPVNWKDPEGQLVFMAVLGPSAVAAIADVVTIGVLGKTISNILDSIYNNENSNDSHEPTEHAKQRSDGAKNDKNRQVGDINKVIKDGRKFQDTDTGNTVHVDGDRVVITDSNGRIVTQFKNPRKNTQDRIKRGRWCPQ